MLLIGDPGVGKSALLDGAAEIAGIAGIRVVRAGGADSVGFSVLNQLLLQLQDGLSRLDKHQQEALSLALGRSEAGARSPLTLSSAALALLRQAASDRPILLIIDDLHRADRPSSTVLGLIARRLSGSRVGLLAAARTGPLDPADIGTGREVRPLDDDASTSLIADSSPDLAPGVRRQIMAQARGNPLALLELPAGLDDLQRSGLAALPTVLPLSRRLREAFSTPVSALPAAAAYLLLLAALEETGDIRLLRAAAGGDPLEDLAPAERAGLVCVDATNHRLVFSHPLFRSAAVDRAPSSEVIRAHLALAAQLADQPERRARHLAEAAAEPDQDVASVLAQVARQLEHRGEANRAVTALMRAAQLSPQRHDRCRLLAEAACLSATRTGELRLARRLLTEARRTAPQPGGPLPPGASLNASVAEARLLEDAGSDINAIHRLLVEAIGDAPGTAPDSDPARHTALRTLLTVCVAAGQPGLWEPFDLALARLRPGECPELRLMAGTHADPARSAAGAVGDLDTAISSLSRDTGHGRVLALSAAAAATDRLAGCREALQRVAREAREGGAAVPSISAQILLSRDGFLSGAWNDAWRLAEDCLQACQSHGSSAQAWIAREQLAIMAAARGEDELLRDLTDDMLRWAMPRGIRLAEMAVHRAGSLAALGRGDFDEAYRLASAISPPGVLASHVPYALETAMDLVEAAVRTGRPRKAAAHVAAVRAAGIAGISPRLALMTTASAAFAAPADEALSLFEQALSVSGADRWPFEFARVQLALGEQLRRVRANREARGHLASALTTFRALGARPWSDRAGNELRATNMTRARMDHQRVPALTAQEQQIVSLAAAGLTNKQIGQRLFLSPRTVGSHLYRVFPKLGVGSRAGLRDALTALAPSDSSPDALGRFASDPVAG